MISLLNNSSDYLSNADKPSKAVASELRKLDLLCRECVKKPFYQKLCQGSRKVFTSASLTQNQLEVIVCYKTELGRLIKEANLPIAYISESQNPTDVVSRYEEKVLFALKDDEVSLSWFKELCAFSLKDILYFRFPMLVNNYDAANEFASITKTRKILVIEGFDFRIHTNSVSDTYQIALAEFLAREDTKIIFIVDKSTPKDATRPLTPIQTVVHEYIEAGVDL